MSAEDIVNFFSDGDQLTTWLVAAGVLVTLIALAMSMFRDDTLARRMKQVGVERERIRARERARMKATAMAQPGNASLRHQQFKPFMKEIVERFSLSKWLSTQDAKTKLALAGFRGPAAETTFLFFRLVSPDRARIRHALLSGRHRRFRPEPADPGGDRARRSLSRREGAGTLSRQHDHEAAGEDETRLPRRDGSPADLRRVGHVDRARLPQGQPGDRHAIGRARRGVRALYGRALVPGGPSGSLSKPLRAYRARRGQAARDRARAGGEIRHAARPRPAHVGAGSPATSA